MAGMTDQEIFDGLDDGDPIAARAAHRRIEELDRQVQELRSNAAQDRRIKDAAIEVCSQIPRMSPVWRVVSPLAAEINGRDPSSYEEGRGRERSAPRAQHDAIVDDFEFFPADFTDALRSNPELFGRMIQDLLKIGTEGPRRPGPRARPEEATHGAELEQLLGKSYTLKTFDAALAELAPNDTIRQLAAKLDVSRANMHRLLSGSLKPDLFHLQKAAEAFNVRPDYFLEFRMIGLVATMVERLTGHSELTVTLWRVATRV